jgi:hypothetical protein
MTFPPLPIEILDPIDDVRYLLLSAPHHLACLQSRLTLEESMKLLDEWMDMVEGIEYSDEVAEQRRMRLEKYQGPGSFVSQAFQQLLIYWIVVTLSIDSPE